MSFRLKNDSVYCTVLSIILFNLTWLSLVFLTSEGVLPAGLFILAAVIFLPYTLRQGLASLIVALIGICVDSLLVVTGFMDFGQSFLPVWLMVLWLGFSLAVHFGLAFIFRLPLLLQALFGAVGGSSSYYAGMVAGSVVFPQSLGLSLLVFAIVWAVLMPLFIYLAVRYRTDSLKNN